MQVADIINEQIIFSPNGLLENVFDRFGNKYNLNDIYCQQVMLLKLMRI